MTILSGRSFLVWPDFCGAGLIGDGVALGKVKLKLDSRLKALLRGENELESSKVVVSKILVDRFGRHI